MVLEKDKYNWLQNVDDVMSVVSMLLQGFHIVLAVGGDCTLLVVVMMVVSFEVIEGAVLVMLVHV